MNTGLCMKERVVILGAGLFAEEIADLLSQTGEHELVGFVEGVDRTVCDRPLLGRPVHWIEDIASLAGSCKALCAVGSPKRKAFIEQATAQGVEFCTVVHPSAQISLTAVLEEGCVVCPSVVIASHTRIGRHTIFNRGCLIGHHADIGEYVTLSPGVNVAGKTRIGPCAYIGMGAIILDGVSIGGHSLVGAGAVVTRDVPDGVRVLGIPAKVVGPHE